MVESGAENSPAVEISKAETNEARSVGQKLRAFLIANGASDETPILELLPLPVAKSRVGFWGRDWASGMPELSSIETSLTCRALVALRRHVRYFALNPSIDTEETSEAVRKLQKAGEVGKINPEALKGTSHGIRNIGDASSILLHEAFSFPPPAPSAPPTQPAPSV